MSCIFSIISLESHYLQEHRRIFIHQCSASTALQRCYSIQCTAWHAGPRCLVHFAMHTLVERTDGPPPCPPTEKLCCYSWGAESTVFHRGHGGAAHSSRAIGCLSRIITEHQSSARLRGVGGGGQSKIHLAWSAVINQESCWTSSHVALGNLSIVAGTWLWQKGREWCALIKICLTALTDRFSVEMTQTVTVTTGFSSHRYKVMEAFQRKEEKLYFPSLW